jgi:hypothetical protein
MYKIELDKAVPGMTVAKSVFTIQDALLIKSNVRLTEKNIYMLKSWGIRELWVDGAAEDDAAAVQVDTETALRDTIDESLRIKFSETLPDPVMEEIMRVAGNLLEKRLQQEEK